MVARRLGFALLLLGVGCVNEYHPEYHPVTETTFVQNVSYPTVVYETRTAPGGPSSPPAPKRRASASEGSRSSAPGDAARVDAAPAPATEADTRLGALPAGRSAPLGGRVVWAPGQAGEAWAGPGGDDRPRLARVATTMRLSDAAKLRSRKYARFTVHPASQTEEVGHALTPLDAWGGDRFDVRRDPAHPELAVVRFDVWRGSGLPTAAPVVVVTSSRGDAEDVIVSYGALEDEEVVADAR